MLWWLGQVVAPGMSWKPTINWTTLSPFPNLYWIGRPQSDNSWQLKALVKAAEEGDALRRSSSCDGRSGGRAALVETAVKVMQRPWTLLLSRGASASELGTPATNNSGSRVIWSC